MAQRLGATPGPVIYSIFIINKSGGLIYNREFLEHSSVNTNDTLRLASMWHGLCEIASASSPVPGCTGIELLQADTFNLHCFQTLTDTKFLLLTDPTTPDNEALLRDTIYNLYCDYVLKNPFYEPEMPIRCDLFDQHLMRHIKSLHTRWGQPFIQ